MSAASKNLRSSYKLQEDETYHTGSNTSCSEDENRANHSKFKKEGYGKSKIERRPTRVPNLKIQNRNALLARENRKKKKEMMDNLERDVNSLHDKNKRLQKIIKTQDSQMKKLNKEINYLKSVLKNQTGIVSILKSLNAKSPLEMINTRDKNCIDSPKSSSETLSCISSDDDLEADDIVTEWDEILKNPLNSMNDFSDISTLDQMSGFSPLSEIATEHSYSLQFDEPSLPGICLHINNERVSLEYCSVCHHNASYEHDN